MKKRESKHKFRSTDEASRRPRFLRRCCRVFVSSKVGLCFRSCASIWIIGIDWDCGGQWDASIQHSIVLHHSNASTNLCGEGFRDGLRVGLVLSFKEVGLGVGFVLGLEVVGLNVGLALGLEVVGFDV